MFTITSKGVQMRPLSPLWAPADVCLQHTLLCPTQNGRSPWKKERHIHLWTALSLWPWTTSSFKQLLSFHLSPNWKTELFNILQQKSFSLLSFKKILRKKFSNVNFLSLMSQWWTQLKTGKKHIFMRKPQVVETSSWDQEKLVLRAHTSLAAWSSCFCLKSKLKPA
jgi:hypothetical protein